MVNKNGGTIKNLSSFFLKKEKFVFFLSFPKPK